ncbi:hypothetical protein ACWIGW_44105 [Nocardia brasiliensis]|uniref:hypothetical protein n=1 Tax=Streptomyces sp. NPDC056056 TaxID=3345698 RepID=UPI0035E2C49E
MFDERKLDDANGEDNAVGEKDESPPPPGVLEPVSTPVVLPAIRPDPLLPVYPPVSPHPPWNTARAAATTAVVGLALVFAVVAMVLGTPVVPTTICTLVLVVGILCLLVPREDRAGAHGGGSFILRLLQALIIIFGGGGGMSGGGGTFGGRT